MAIDKNKIREYHNLKKAIEKATGRLEKLNKEIKAELTPGHYQIGEFKVDVSLRTKFDYDYSQLSDDVFYRCLVETIDPQLVESAYLREEIAEDEMRLIRGDAKIITSLSIERTGNVQAEL